LLGYEGGYGAVRRYARTWSGACRPDGGRRNDDFVVGSMLGPAARTIPNPNVKVGVTEFGKTHPCTVGEFLDNIDTPDVPRKFGQKAPPFQLWPPRDIEFPIAEISWLTSWNSSILYVKPWRVAGSNRGHATTYVELGSQRSQDADHLSLPRVPAWTRLRTRVW
jgi:hypothetical protein